MKLITAVLVILIFSGCSTFYRIRVNGYLDQENKIDISSDKSIFIVVRKEVKNPLLEKEVGVKIRKLLEERKFQIGTLESSDFYLIYDYGIGSGKEVTGVRKVTKKGGTATIHTPGSLSSTIQMPRSTSYVPFSVTQYPRWLTLTLVDGDIYRKKQEISTVWTGEVVSSGRSSDLREVINYLLIPAIDNFGKDTGKQIRTDIYEGDPRVKAITER